MSLHPRTAVVLDRPQLAENIGAVARVMANFGLEDLRLVAPRDGWPQERAWAAASGANWPLDGARVFATAAEALFDRDLVLAATARPREVQLEVVTPRAAADRVVEAEAAGGSPALLFGGERAGLETADIALAQLIVTIPVETRFRSLNLAQAVAVLAYERRVRLDAAPPAAFRGREPPAPGEALQGLYAHLEGELDAAGFFYPPENRPSMVRNLRAALGRAQLSQQEVRTLRGVVTALVRGRGRTLQRLAAEPREP